MKHRFLLSFFIFLFLSTFYHHHLYAQIVRNCSHCQTSDPIEATTQLVLAHVPIVVNSFIKIVQEPNNKETVAQNISTIISSIANVAVSAFKGRETKEIERLLQHLINYIFYAHTASSSGSGNSLIIL